MKGFKSTLANPYTYTQSGVWKKGQYTFQAIVLSDSGYAFAFQRSDTTWQTVDLSWQVKYGSYSKIQWTFTLEADAVAFRLIANTVTGETIVVQPMLEKGSNGSTPIAHEEDLRGMDGDFHEFIYTRNDTGIAPPTPLSTQENDYIPIDDSVEPPVIWTDNPKGVTKEIPFEFVSMREKKNGVWLDFSPPSLWAKWSEDGLSVNIRVQGHYQSHWEGVNKVTEIVGGEIINGTEVVKCTAVFRKGEEDIASDVASSRGFIWEVNGVEIARDVPYITLDESYGDGFADYVTLSYLIGNKRESDQAEILNISEGMDGIGEEFIFKANNSEETPPALPSTTDEGYQNDDYHGNWSDDPVAPTESNKFVWAAKRKKVGGIWEAFGTPSVWTKWVKDGDDAKSLILSASSLTMACYSTNAAKPGQTITINAKLQNVSGTATFVATPYNDAGTALTAITLGGSGNTRTLTSSQWLSTFQKVVITATLSGLSDSVTITRLSDGAPGADGSDGTPGADGEPAKTITLSANATKITVGQGNVSSPTQISVKATAVNTTIDVWEYSINGGAFTATRPSFVTSVSTTERIISSSTLFKTITLRASRFVDEASDTITISREGGAPYVDSTTRTWWEWNDSSNLYVDTGMSPVGVDGAIPYPAGYYDNTKRYRREQDYTPYVQYGETLYLLIKDTPYAGIPPTNTTYWKAFNQWEAVFVDSLVASFAKIGGAVFTGDTSDVSSNVRGRLISQKGVDNTNNYNTYTGDSGSWQPKLMLDFETGKAVFDEAKIRGEVEATSGKFTGEINATSGTIGGFNIGSTYIGTGSPVGGSVNGMSLSNDFIVFNQSNRQALIGPVSDLGFDFLGRFRDTTSKPGYTKTGVIINISGGYKNNALDVTGDILLNGNMSLKGAIDGLSVRTRQISTTTYLTSEDVYVSCYNSTSITVYLPSSPVIGKVIFIRTINTATVTVNGNGKTINWGTGTGASRGVGDGVGDTAMLVYDGQFWLYNHLVR